MNNKERKITIKMPRLDKMINESFVPLWYCQDRYMILYGSRGSSKSDFVAKNLIFRMLTHKFFRGVCIRKVERTINGSVFQNFKDNIVKMGLSEHFRINENPMRITCLINGNQMLFRGMDVPEKIKSITDISMLWWEENIDYTDSEYTTVSTSMRAPKADFIQEIFTINPIMPDYQSHWFWKKFFYGEDALSFRKKFEVSYNDKTYVQFATIHNSTWRNNKWLKSDFIQDMESKKYGDPYIYLTQSMGIWAQEVAVGRFYKNFNVGKNTIEKKKYDPERPIHLSFDFNNNPYSGCGVFQIYDKKCYLIREICLKSPKNKLTEVIKEINNIYQHHDEAVYIYGDPNGYKEDTTKEKGDNAFRMIFAGLSSFNTKDKTTRSAPSVRARQNWINDIFDVSYDDIEFVISMECRNAINDFTMLKEDPAKGGKLKEKGIDNDTGIVSEKYGHLSDLCDYFLCVYFNDSFERHKNGGELPKVSYGVREKRGIRGV